MTTQLPSIHIVATGGSIAGVGPDRLDYILYPELGQHLTIQQSLERVPEVMSVAQVSSEDLISVGSTAIGAPEWVRLAARINDLLQGPVDGVVVTHGTATLEETAYFLHLTVKSSKPVVVTGAMRPPTSISTDADLNLLDAVRVVASPQASGLGVLTILNNEIQCARGRNQGQHLPGRDLQAQRTRLSRLLRFRRPGGALPGPASETHRLNTLPGGRVHRASPRGHRLFLRRLRRDAD